jgi:hypothetical protein
MADLSAIDPVAVLVRGRVRTLLSLEPAPGTFAQDVPLRVTGLSCAAQPSATGTGSSSSGDLQPVLHVADAGASSRVILLRNVYEGCEPSSSGAQPLLSLLVVNGVAQEEDEGGLAAALLALIGEACGEGSHTRNSR